MPPKVNIDRPVSTRQAQVIARFLSNKGQGNFPVSACYYKSTRQIARAYYGSKAKETHIESLALELLAEVGVKPTPEPVIEKAG